MGLEDALCNNPAANLSPLLPVEDVCIAALRAQCREEATSDDEWSPARRNLRQAWAQAELAMSPDIDEGTATDYFDDVAVHLDRIDDLQPPFEILFDAGLLEGYLPLMRRRRTTNRPRTIQQRLDLGLHIAALMDRGASDDTQQLRHYAVKSGLHLIFNRSELEFYPASVREGRNRDRATVRLNQDGHVLYDGRKVPIKSRGSASRAKQYDPRILYLPYRSIIMKAITEMTGVNMPDRIDNEFAPILAAEIRGERLDDHELAWADSVTDTITDMVVDFCRR